MAKRTEPEVEGIELAAEEEVVSKSSIDRLTDAIMLLAQRDAAKGSDPESKTIMEALTLALNQVSQNQLKGAEVVAQSYRQVHRPSNEVVHERSVFHPRGNPSLFPSGDAYVKPMLRCPCHVPRNEEPNDNMLTREETELLNILVECPGTYVITRIDDTKIKLNVKVDYAVDDITPSRLLMQNETGYNNEYFRLMPALHSQLRQIFAQHSDLKMRARAAAVLTMDAEYALIKAGKLSIAA